MIETAVLLLDVQNEFFTPGGKLHDGVKNVMEKTGMRKNLPSFVKQMREEGAKVIYAHVNRQKKTDQSSNEAMEDHSFGDEIELFEEGSWNSDFPEEVKPKKGDQILSGRKKLSAFQGTELEVILKLKWEKIEKLYVVGFLTDVQILETIKEAHDLGLTDEGLEIFIVKDCCAAETIEAHEYAVDYSLRLFCETTTSQEVLDSIMHTEDYFDEIEKGSEVSEFKKSFQDGLKTSESKKSSRDDFKTIRHIRTILKFGFNRSDVFMWKDYLKYVFLSLFLQFSLGHNYIFNDNIIPACIKESYTFGGPNFGICTFERNMEKIYNSLRTLVSFVLAGFISHTVMLYQARRTNYCQVCGANRNLILQISSLLPVPSPNDENYEEVQQERDTMERWAILGYELAILKAKGMMDSPSGRVHLESLGLIDADEWDKMVEGDRHTTVWYWIQQKAVYLTEEGIISSELRLHTMCSAVTNMRDKANDLMSVIDRDNPHAYTFVVGLLVHLNLVCLSLHKGVEWAIWFYESQGKIYMTGTMYADLLMYTAIVITFTMLYDIAIVLYNPFHERPCTDDVPHCIVGVGIRHLAEKLGEATTTRPSTMFWMKSQEEDRKRLGLRCKPSGKSAKRLFRASDRSQSSRDFQQYLLFEEVTGGKLRNTIRRYKFN